MIVINNGKYKGFEVVENPISSKPFNAWWRPKNRIYVPCMRTFIFNETELSLDEKVDLVCELALQRIHKRIELIVANELRRPRPKVNLMVNVKGFEQATEAFKELRKQLNELK